MKSFSPGTFIVTLTFKNERHPVFSPDISPGQHGRINSCLEGLILGSQTSTFLGTTYSEGKSENSRQDSGNTFGVAKSTDDLSPVHASNGKRIKKESAFFIFSDIVFAIHIF